MTKETTKRPGRTQDNGEERRMTLKKTPWVACTIGGDGRIHFRDTGRAGSPRERMGWIERELHDAQMDDRFVTRWVVRIPMEEVSESKGDGAPGHPGVTSCTGRTLRTDRDTLADAVGVLLLMHRNRMKVLEAADHELESWLEGEQG